MPRSRVIREVPLAVAIKSLASRAMYSSWINPSIIAARVAGAVEVPAVEVPAAAVPAAAVAAAAAGGRGPRHRDHAASARSRARLSITLMTSSRFRALESISTASAAFAI